MPAMFDRPSFYVYSPLTGALPLDYHCEPRYSLVAIYDNFLSALSAVRRVNAVHDRKLYY